MSIRWLCQISCTLLIFPATYILKISTLFWPTIRVILILYQTGNSGKSPSGYYAYPPIGALTNQLPQGPGTILMGSLPESTTLCHETPPEIIVIEIDQPSLSKRIKIINCTVCGQMLRKSTRVVQVFSPPEHLTSTSMVTEN